MNKIFDLIIDSYWGALILIILGVCVVIYTKKNPQKNPESIIQSDYRGNLGGYGLILLGILIILLKILGKW